LPKGRRRRRLVKQQQPGHNRGQAVAGLVTGALALVIRLFFAASIGAFFATNVNDFRQFGRCLDAARGDQAREACAEQLERNLDQ
jgi:hypothetical protein